MTVDTKIWNAEIMKRGGDTMATITLYKDKLNGVGSFINGILKHSNNLDTQLTTLKSTLQGIDSSTYNLDAAVESIRSSSKSEKDKVSDLKKLNKEITNFINTVTNRDNSARNEINKRKKDFYTKYKYLKPDSEKNALDYIAEDFGKVCDWCKEHWEQIKIAIAVVLVVAAVVVLVVFSGGTALGVFATLAVAAAKGVLLGAAIGGAIGGVSGYAQNGVSGILPGIINGGADGAIMGGVFGLLGGLGGLAGAHFGCSAVMEKIFAASTKMSFAMLGFDGLALLSDFQNRLSLDTGIKFEFINSSFGNFISNLNHKAHENPFYNAFQLTVGATAVFTGGYVKSAACFVAGTMVATINGLKAIENIKSGEKVLSFNFNTMKTEYKPVVRTYLRKVKKLVHLSVEGEVIVTTEDHPFYVKGKGFINASLLNVGTELLNNDGRLLIIDAIYREAECKETEVYNLQIDENHSYYVGKIYILVHNGGYDRAQKYSENWSDESLSNTIEEIAPDSEPVNTETGKTIYRNNKTGQQVVYDNEGDYFRIEDTNLPGKRVYTDINGKPIPNNKVVNGKQVGISKSEYNAMTHFNNIDGK
jgi:UDP-2,3-diacylglucosamine pyrophosphatase LpxH